MPSRTFQVGALVELTSPLRIVSSTHDIPRGAVGRLHRRVDRTDMWAVEFRWGYAGPFAHDPGAFRVFCRTDKLRVIPDAE